MSPALPARRRATPATTGRSLGWVLGVGLAYLLAECWLNLVILEQAAGGEMQAATLEWLMPAGRLLGGLGLTLVVVRLGVAWLGLGVLRTWLLALPLCMLGMWYGQAEVLDRLVDLSSGAQRQMALHDALLAVPQRAAPAGDTHTPHEVRARLKTVLAPLLDAPLALDGANDEALRQRLLQSLAPACPATPGAVCPCPVAAAWLPAAQGAGPVAEVPALPTLRRCLVQPRLAQADAAFAAYQRQAAGASSAQSAGAPALPPGLTRAQFDERTGAHRKFRRTLQARGLLAETDACQDGMRLDADDDMLERCVRQPLLQQALESKRQLLALPASAFEGTGDQASLGRMAYRRAIGVPVALGFSLFFCTLNAWLLLLALAEAGARAWQRRRWRRQAAEGAAASGGAALHNPGAAPHAAAAAGAGPAAAQGLTAHAGTARGQAAPQRPAGLLAALGLGTAKLALGVLATLAVGSGPSSGLPTWPGSTAELDRQAATWIWHAEPRAVALLRAAGLAPALATWQPPEPVRAALRRLDDHL